MSPLHARFLVFFLALGFLSGAAEAKTSTPRLHITSKGRQAKPLAKAASKALRSQGVALAKRPKRSSFLLSVSVQKRRKKLVATVVLSKRGGTEVDRWQRSGRTRKALLRNINKADIWSKVGAAIASSSEEEDSAGDDDQSGDDDEDELDDEDEPDGEDEPDDRDEPDNQGREDSPGDDDSSELLSSSEASHKATKIPSLRVGLGLQGVHRRLRYNDDIFEALATYTLPLAAAATAHVEANPSPKMQLRGSLTRTSEFSSSDSFSDYPTHYNAWTLEARYRHRLSALNVLAGAGYGGSRFTVSGQDPAGARIPEVRYRFLRASVAAEYPLTESVVLVGGAGYRYMLESGEIATAAFFPRLTNAAVDGSARVRVALFNGLALDVGASAVRYYYALKPQLGDALIAGGATDDFLSMDIGVSYAY